MLTRRCTQRQYLLVPEKEINNAFLYCLIEAAQQFDIVLLLSQMMSNHHHTPFYDPKGNVVEFTHRFHTNLAKCVNAFRGRWGNMWSSDPPCLVELVGVNDLVDKLIYTATNPVKAALVNEVHCWPGPKTVQAFLDGRTLKARRPWFLFRSDGEMPEEVELTFDIPEAIGDHAEIVERVRAGIAEVEASVDKNRPIVGRRRVLRQSWRESPTSREPRRGIRPRVAARCEWKRREALQRNKKFQTAYRDARAAWLAGIPVTFPFGTYWLRKYANVPIDSVDRCATTSSSSY
jgi:putative transposase